MRIATWDVNSLKARPDKVRWWLDRARPDVLLMQETNLTDAAAPVEVFRDAGYFPISRRRASCSAFEWAEDGRAPFVGRRAGPAWHIRRLDLQTGREAPWTEITPRETAGLRLSWVYLTPSGRFWAHSYSRLLTDLYVAEGLR
jgi:exodeoxyribonuclease III